MKNLQTAKRRAQGELIGTLKNRSSEEPLFDIINGARSATDLRHRKRLILETLGSRLPYGEKHKLGELKSLIEGSPLPLSLQRAARGTRIHEETKEIGKQTFKKEEGEARPDTIIEEPVFQTTYKSKAVLKLKLRRRYASLICLSALWALAYLGGYPPPQRFLVPSQLQNYSRQMKRCSGSHDGMLGDILPEQVANLRAKLLCSESRYRSASGIKEEDAAFFKKLLEKHVYIDRPYKKGTFRIRLSRNKTIEDLYSYFEKRGALPLPYGYSPVDATKILIDAEREGIVVIR